MLIAVFITEMVILNKYVFIIIIIIKNCYTYYLSQIANLTHCKQL